jgi:hypothetical protein
MITSTFLHTAAPLALFGPQDQGLSSLLSAAIALGAVIVLLLALRKVAQVVSALLAAAAAVGSVVVLVVIVFGLFAAALMINPPIG